MYFSGCATHVHSGEAVASRDVRRLFRASRPVCQVSFYFIAMGCKVQNPVVTIIINSEKFAVAYVHFVSDTLCGTLLFCLGGVGSPVYFLGEGKGEFVELATSNISYFLKRHWLPEYPWGKNSRRFGILLLASISVLLHF